MTRSVSVATLLATLFCSTMLWSQPLREIDWADEIGLLGREVAQRHCNLFFQKDSAAFFSAMEQVADGAGEHSLFENSVRLQQVLAGMGDPQTRINYHFNIDPGSILPLVCYWFGDGIFILGTRAAYKEILGGRLTAINDYPMDRIVDSLSTLLGNGNPSLLRAQIPAMIGWTPLLEFFGFGDPGGFRLQYENRQGRLNTLSFIMPLQEGDEVSLQPEQIPLGWQDRKSFFRDRYFPEEKIYYIQYNRCWSREAEESYGTGATALFMPSFKAFEKQVFQTIKKEEIDKFVFDLRFNGGGNETQGSGFIKKLGGKKFKGDGEVFVIVGQETSGAAVINAFDFLKYTKAMIVGEGTGGMPNHYGEVERFILPGSRLVVNYSTRYFRMEEEGIPSLLPDIPAPFLFDDYMQGRDPAMEAIRNHRSR